MTVLQFDSHAVLQKDSNVLFTITPNQTAKAIIQDFLENKRLTSHFQPIVNLAKGEIFAYEALCRTTGPNPFGNIEEIFHQAKMCGMMLELDMRCRENGILQSAAQNLHARDALLFLNICPTSLLHPDHSFGATGLLAKQHGFSRQDIVLEITEHDAVSNYQLFKKSIDHYRSEGFRIAIDDFGAGYGGLKMLSVLEPDFVKIDRHFFRDPQKSSINYTLIDSIATACHRIGIDVIAEGVENVNDLRVCREIGIDLIQGYLIARPSADLVSIEQLDVPAQEVMRQSGTRLFDEVICVGDIASHVRPLCSTERTLEVLDRFNENPATHCLPVLKGGQLCGLINRHRFMENHMVGRFGYGLSLNYYKKVEDILDDDFLEVAHYSTVEEVARKIHLRKQISIYDDICVTRSGRYVGTVSVSAILNAVTDNSMILARGANPLTGLPGNDFIQRQIAKMLSQAIHFDVCYIDLDSFKPFNDRHGFEMGDRVIKAVGDCIVEVLKKWEIQSIGFVGHIGGDDFIMITRPKNSVAACEDLIGRFTRMLDRFHTEEECRQGFYLSCDRSGNSRQFGLLSLSIGIVSTEIHHISSFAEVSSIASDLKKRAKDTQGSVIVRDRRVTEAVKQKDDPEGMGTTSIDSLNSIRSFLIK
jgi:diguanylate cyclase (GGDEF)-like protein